MNLDFSSRAAIASPAKINFGLWIPFRKPDGFHHIVSLFLPVSLQDTLYLERGHGKAHFISRLPTHFEEKLKPAFSSDQLSENLIGKALSLFSEILREHNLPPLPKLDVTIEKRIPSPAGLGGGSSNAGTILKHLASMLPPDDYERMYPALRDRSLSIGSDIPFFLNPVPSLVSGQGEVITEIHFPSFAGIAGIPDFGFSTRVMFAELKKTLQSDAENKSVLAHSFRECASLLKRVWKDNGSNGLSLPFAEQRSKELKEFLFQWEQAIPADSTLAFNEFLDVAVRLFPENGMILQSGMDALSRTLSLETGQNVFYGMSGSGSSFYAISPGDPDSGKVTRALETLQRDISHINWYSIQSF